MGTVWSIGAVDKVIAAVSGVEVGTQSCKKVEIITLDSRAGASCWPENLLKSDPMGPNVKGVKFNAANEAELKYYVGKKVRFCPRAPREAEARLRGACAMRTSTLPTQRSLAQEQLRREDPERRPGDLEGKRWDVF